MYILYIFIAKYQIRNLILEIEIRDSISFFLLNLLSDFLKQSRRVCFAQIDVRGRVAHC